MCATPCRTRLCYLESLIEIGGASSGWSRIFVRLPPSLWITCRDLLEDCLVPSRTFLHLIHIVPACESYSIGPDGQILQLCRIPHLVEHSVCRRAGFLHVRTFRAGISLLHTQHLYMVCWTKLSDSSCWSIGTRAKDTLENDG